MQIAKWKTKKSEQRREKRGRRKNVWCKVKSGQHLHRNPLGDCKLINILIIFSLFAFRLCAAGRNKRHRIDYYLRLESITISIIWMEFPILWDPWSENDTLFYLRVVAAFFFCWWTNKKKNSWRDTEKTNMCRWWFTLNPVIFRSNAMPIRYLNHWINQHILMHTAHTVFFSIQTCS